MGWIKNKIIGLMMALSRTENFIKNDKEGIDLGEGKFQSHKQGMLSHSLINGVMTHEVKELRWRVYKVLQHANNLTAQIKGYDSDGNPIVETTSRNRGNLRRYKSDKTDVGKLLIVVDNQTLPLNTFDSIDNLNPDREDISRDDYLTKFKNKKTIFINRDHQPMFQLEDYVTKLLIREQNDDKVLLEFYVSKYPSEDRRSRLFLSEIKKIVGGKRSPILEFNNVLFISNKCMGVDDHLEFEFAIEKYHRITEYEGSYVIKFLGTRTIYGENILDKYKLDDLEEKYIKKEKK